MGDTTIRLKDAVTGNEVEATMPDDAMIRELLPEGANSGFPMEGDVTSRKVFLCRSGSSTSVLKAMS